MQPLRVRIDRIVDFDVVVSLIGIDTETTRPVAVHIDHRPFAVFRQALQKAGLARPIEYAASRLVLHVDILPADGAASASTNETDSSTANVITDDRGGELER